MESTGLILRSEAYEPLTTKGSELTFEDLDGNFIKIYQDIYTALQLIGEREASIPATGNQIDFSLPKIFNLPTSPGSGNITDDLDNAKIGIVQKIYHQKGTVPTFPAGWVLIGTGTYSTTLLNIIYAEWVTETRVEYWIINTANEPL